MLLRLLRTDLLLKFSHIYLVAETDHIEELRLILLQFFGVKAHLVEFLLKDGLAFVIEVLALIQIFE
jgi:hypothetical protein